MQKDKERDISEKIALGMPNASHNTGEIQFDSRLFGSAKVFYIQLDLKFYAFRNKSFFEKRDLMLVSATKKATAFMISRGVKLRI